MGSRPSGRLPSFSCPAAPGLVRPWWMPASGARPASLAALVLAARVHDGWMAPQDADATSLSGAAPAAEARRAGPPGRLAHAGDEAGAAGRRSVVRVRMPASGARPASLAALVLAARGRRRLDGAAGRRCHEADAGRRRLRRRGAPGPPRTPGARGGRGRCRGRRRVVRSLTRHRVGLVPRAPPSRRRRAGTRSLRSGRRSVSHRVAAACLRRRTVEAHEAPRGPAPRIVARSPWRPAPGVAATGAPGRGASGTKRWPASWSRYDAAAGLEVADPFGPWGDAHDESFAVRAAARRELLRAGPLARQAGKHLVRRRHGLQYSTNGRLPARTSAANERPHSASAAANHPTTPVTPLHGHR